MGSKVEGIQEGSDGEKGSTAWTPEGDTGWTH